MALVRVPYKKKKTKVQALISSSNKIKVIMLAYILKLGLKIRYTNGRA